MWLSGVASALFLGTQWACKVTCGDTVLQLQVAPRAEGRVAFPWDLVERVLLTCCAQSCLFVTVSHADLMTPDFCLTMPFLSLSLSASLVLVQDRKWATRLQCGPMCGWAIRSTGPLREESRVMLPQGHLGEPHRAQGSDTKVFGISPICPAKALQSSFKRHSPHAPFSFRLCPYHLYPEQSKAMFI